MQSIIKKLKQGADMYPKKIYYEPEALEYALGKKLKNMYTNVEWIPIKSHNNIEELRTRSNYDFTELKKYLIVGIRKTHKYNENKKISDYLVPYSSSGCSAMCLYCYLVCNYNKCSYLRIYVNIEQMLDNLINKSRKTEKISAFEIGSNSDLILENEITGNLIRTIEEFGNKGRGFITFPTKFNMVDKLINLNHNGKVIFRMSVNPEMIIKKVEIGTSSLNKRIEAVNKMCEAGYRVGLLIAPVILIDSWKELYVELLNTLFERLSDKVKSEMFLEVIFMTYSYVQNAINNQAFPGALRLYNRELMTGRGRGKYYYRQEYRDEAEAFLIKEIKNRFKSAEIVYVV